MAGGFLLVHFFNDGASLGYRDSRRHWEGEEVGGAFSVTFTVTATRHGSCLKPHDGCCMDHVILDVGGEMAGSRHLTCGPKLPALQ